MREDYAYWKIITMQHATGKDMEEILVKSYKQRGRGLKALVMLQRQ